MTTDRSEEMEAIAKRFERIENALIVIAEFIKSGEYESVPDVVKAVLSETELGDSHEG